MIRLGRNLASNLSFLLLLSLFFAGCAPKKAEQEETPLAPRPTATPSTDPFTILLETSDTGEFSLHSTLERDLPVPAGWHLEWKRPENYSGSWDLALIGPTSLEASAPEIVDLGSVLDEVFPLHKSDFIVSASDLRQEGRLLGVPILFRPHFLYAKQENLATREGLEVYLSEGKTIALPRGVSGEWYRNRLNADSNQVLWTDPGEEENPFAAGQVEVAIADRSWLAKGGVLPNQVFSLQGLALAPKIPDWGVRLAISNGCANRELADSILKRALTQLQEKLVGVGGWAFPVRRSVYQSPRIQGAFLRAPKPVFDTTLENLGNPESIRP